MSEFAECPKCGGTHARKVTFTWWGGLVGPKLLHHVKCDDCGTAYNGRTGELNTRNIIIYTLVVGVPLCILVAVLFFYLFSNAR